MNQKTGVLLLLAVAGCYSYVPSQAAKTVRKLRREAFGKKTAGEKKVLYLTFDDGPHPVYTEKLLNLLAVYNIRATFFLVAEFAEAYPEIVERMQAEGHSIGMHSSDHRSAMLSTPAVTASDFRRSFSVMKKLKINTKLYRPPWGHVNLASLVQIRKYGLKKVLWDVMAEDWKPGVGRKEIAEKLLKRARPGDIICLHDRRGDERIENEKICAQPQEMIAALHSAIRRWIREGYSFDVIR